MNSAVQPPVRPPTGSPEGTALLHVTPNQRAWRRFRRNRPAVFSGVVLLGFFALIAIWPFFQGSAFEGKIPQAWRHPPNQFSELQFQAPTGMHLFGTDVHGRDLLSRVVYGARISLLVGLVGAGVSLVIGVLWGAVAGYAGGRLDSAMMRFVDILYSLPSIVFVIVLITTLDGALKNWSTPEFRIAHLKRPERLVERVSQAQDPAPNFLKSTASPEGQVLFGQSRSALSDSDLKILVAELNRFVHSPEAHRAFAPPTSSGGRTNQVSWTNRKVLLEAFPDELRAGQNFVTRFLVWFFVRENSAATQLVFLFAGLGAVSWLTMARIVRGQVLSLRQQTFVQASRVLGATHSRILWRHILPNVAAIVIVYLTLLIPSIVLYESFLSYLGLGVQPPQASLGSLIAEGASQINPIRMYWWMIVFPAFTLGLTLLGLNFVGDGLRDAFESRDAQ